MTTFGHKISKLRMTTYNWSFIWSFLVMLTPTMENYNFDNEFVQFTKF